MYVFLVLRRKNFFLMNAFLASHSTNSDEIIKAISEIVGILVAADLEGKNVNVNSVKSR